jgi:hypothetical protein
MNGLATHRRRAVAIATQQEWPTALTRLNS